MKNYIVEKLAKLLPEFALQAEKSLQDTYAIKDFQISISSRFELFLYSLTCSDNVHGFTSSYGENYDTVLSEFVSKLTKHSDIREKKLAKIAELTAQLYDGE